MVRFLQSRGFAVIPIRGSHHVMFRGDLRTSLPVHGSEALKIGTLRAILRDVDIGAEQFVRLWHR
ncbi:MAG: type II toxin-antitoxin system HicA family toxin [Bryobacterales bacterium]|nr:type II toxin-antitoxin system HicA family toxin [Bryobacterales bacterium]